MAVNKRFPLPPGAESYGHPFPWNSTIRPEVLHATFARQAAAQGAAPMVDFLGRTFTYAELYREARLLDNERWDDWLALLAEDIHYWMPTMENRRR